MGYAEMAALFQYRKRYEVTCDKAATAFIAYKAASFNTASGMRSHVTTMPTRSTQVATSFNTASGMRSHVTLISFGVLIREPKFQYRKRYEVTCDEQRLHDLLEYYVQVSIPQAV